MDDVPVDATYLWVGLAATSLLALGVVVSLPTNPPAATDCAAATVESVATSPHEATAQCPVDARRVRVEPHRIALKTPDGTAHASVAAGPVTPAGDGGLGTVLGGTPPGRVYDSSEALRQAAARARAAAGQWQTVDGPLRARRVTWEGVDVTLVGV